MNFETIIGIEIHAELLTNTKAFSPSKIDYNQNPNQTINQIDFGMPGAMPLINKNAINKALKAALALNCQINKIQTFDRKNYFYYDNSKGYQITQDKTPMGFDGSIKISKDEEIAIERIHLEEDTAKQTQIGDVINIDFNRAGNPLIEIVTKPVIKNKEQAANYVKVIRQILIDNEISNAKMEEGSLRCDINVSIRPVGYPRFLNKTEIKNLNSINNIKKAIDNEIKEQESNFLKGILNTQTTKRFDERSKTNVIMRTKETKDEYRYHREFDILPIIIDEKTISKVKEQIKIDPISKIENLKNNYNLNNSEIEILSTNSILLDLYIDSYKNNLNPKITYDLLTSFILKEIKEINEIKLSASDLNKITNLIVNEEISNKNAKIIIKEALINELDIDKYIKDNDLLQINDQELIKKAAIKIINQNPREVELIKNGKDRLFGYLNGLLIKEFKGKANPKICNRVLTSLIKES